MAKHFRRRHRNARIDEQQPEFRKRRQFSNPLAKPLHYQRLTDEAGRNVSADGAGDVRQIAGADVKVPQTHQTTQDSSRICGAAADP